MHRNALTVGGIFTDAVIWSHYSNPKYATTLSPSTSGLFMTAFSVRHGATLEHELQRNKQAAPFWQSVSTRQVHYTVYVVPHWQKEINFNLPTLTLKRTTETRRNRFVLFRKAHKLELKTRKTFWLFRMRTLTPPSKSIISLPEPHPHCKRTLTVSRSTLPFISSFAWILTLLFRGEERGCRSSYSS